MTDSTTTPLDPIHLTFLGAGSMFCPTLCRDVLAIPGAESGSFRLVDVDAERLGMMAKVVGQLIQSMNRPGWTVTATTDRREALPGSDFAVCCVEVSGLECVHYDNDIPLKYGVDQCIGDTIGPGGLFKGLRTIPVFLDILRDMAELCPDAPMLNYTNPMSMMCLAAARAVPEVKVVGLCHSVQDTSKRLAQYAGVPYDELTYDCAGINHLAWFTRLEHHGANLYDTKLTEQFTREIAEAYDEEARGLARHDDYDLCWNPDQIDRPYQHEDLVRKDMCLHFGAFITESSGHLSEYLPYYRKSEDGRKLLRLAYDGGSRFYAANWPRWRTEADERRQRIVSGEETLEPERSHEYASWIIEAIRRDRPFHIHGNVMNYDTGKAADRPIRAHQSPAGTLITNLPTNGCVEVACLVDGHGIHPTRYGALPPQMAHLCASNMAVFDLGATAAIQRSQEAAIHALLLDPLCQAVLTPRQIKAMTLELFEAEKEYLIGFN